MLRGGEETTPPGLGVSAASVEPPLSLARRMTKREERESIILFLCRSIGATTAVEKIASSDSRKLATCFASLTLKFLEACCLEIVLRYSRMYPSKI